MVLGDPVDFLVCFGSRGSRSRRLNAHRRESGLVHRRDSGLVPRRHSRFAGLIIDATRLRLSSFSLLVSAVLKWSVTHLFDSLGRPNRLRELNTRPDPRR